MAKIIGFTLKFEGTDVALKNITDLEMAQKALNEQLKKTSDDTAYEELNADLIKVKASLAAARKEQADMVRQMEAAADGAGSYRKLNAELVKLRSEFKQLSAAERNGAIGKDMIKNIQALDRELKDIDASIGQFQRNVGNYPEFVRTAITSAIPGLGELQGAISNVGEAGGKTGKLLGTAFAVFAAGGIAYAGITTLSRLSAEVNNLRGQVQQLTGESSKAVDENTARLMAISDTYGYSQENLLRAVNAASKHLGLTMGETLGYVEKSLLAGADIGQEFLDQIREYGIQFKASGATAEQFFAIVTKGSREGVFSDKMPDLVKEFGLRIREQTKSTKVALVNAFGDVFAKDLLERVDTGKTSTIQALSEIAKKMKDTTIPISNLGAVLADVFAAPGEDAGGIEMIVKTFADMDLTLDSLIDTESEYVQQQRRRLEANKELASAEIELATAIAGTKDLETGLIEIKAKMLSILARVIDFVIKNKEVLIGAAAGYAAYRISLIQATTATQLFSSVLKAIPFVAIGAALTAIIGAVTDFNSEIEDSVDTTEILSRNMKQLNDNYAAEKMSLENLFGALNEANKGRGDKSAIITEIQSKYGAYIGNINLETAGQEELMVAYNNANRAIVNQLVTKQKEVAVQEVFNKLTERTTALNAVRLEQQAELAKNGGVLSIVGAAGQGRVDELRGVMGGIEGEIQVLRDQMAQVGREFDGVAEQIFSGLSQDAFNALTGSFDKTAQATRRAAAATDDGTKKNKEHITTLDSLRAALEKMEAQLLKLKGTPNAIPKELLDGITKTKEQIKELQAEIDKLMGVRKAGPDTVLPGRALNLAPTEAEARREMDAIIKQYQSAKAIIELNEKQITRSIAGQRANREKTQVVADRQTLQARKMALIQEIEAIEAAISEINIRVKIDGITEEERAKLMQQRQELLDQLNEVGNQQAEGMNNDMMGRLEMFQSYLSQSLGMIEQFYAAQDQMRIDDADREIASRNDRIAALQAQLSTTTTIEQQAIQARINYEAAKIRELEKRKAEIEKEGARRRKGIAIIESIINTAVAVTKVIANPILAGIVGAFGLAQTALIAAQKLARGGQLGKVPLNGGGMIDGPSHAGGGVRFAFAGRPYEAEGGEAVIVNGPERYVLNKRTIADPRLRAAASRLNVMGGGVPFLADGGSLGRIPAPFMPIAATTAAPDMTGLLAGMMQQMEQRTAALLNVVANLKVTLNTNELERHQAQKTVTNKVITLTDAS